MPKKSELAVNRVVAYYRRRESVLSLQVHATMSPSATSKITTRGVQDARGPAGPGGSLFLLPWFGDSPYCSSVWYRISKHCKERWPLDTGCLLGALCCPPPLELPPPVLGMHPAPTFCGQGADIQGRAL